MKEKKRPYHVRPILIHRTVKSGANVIGNRSSTSDNNFYSVKTCRVGYVTKLYALLLAFWRQVPRMKIMTRYNKSKHILDLE